MRAGEAGVRVPLRGRTFLSRAIVIFWEDRAFGGGSDAGATLAHPIRDTLFFAGEATAAGGRNGTVDGAIASGRRAADEAVRALRGYRV